MSTLYNLEPQPTAKALIKTSSGDIVVEIWAKQVPLAARNFLQHCLDGYYDNTIFHRLVPGFIIQGGDPTGLGTGGASALDNGAPFADEFHSRLRFNRRGLLGMANSGEANDNTSQFFFTLDKTPELQGKNTMFGRVEGDTIYNLMKMAEADLAEEGGDRPLYPTKITATEVLVNPFDDMVKRVQVAERTRDTEVKTKKKRKAGKQLLSFGGDDGELSAPVVKRAKVNPNFKSSGAENGDKSEKAPRTEKAKAPKPTMRERSASDSASPPPASATRDVATRPKPKSPSPFPSPEPAQVRTTMSALERTNAQIAELKASMKRNTNANDAKPEKKKSALEEMIPATATRGRKRGKATDETGAMDMFKHFRSRLGHVPAATTDNDERSTPAVTSQAEAASDTPGIDGEEKLCDLHFIVNCQSCTAWDDEGKKEEENDDDENWMSHQLSFAKDTLGKDLEWKRKMEELEVVDPREKARELVGDKKKDRKLGKGREWDSRRDNGGGNRARVR